MESELLKVYLEEYSLLEEVLKKAIIWENEANSLLQNAEHLWKTDIGEGITGCFIPRLEWEVLLMDSALDTGISLRLEFNLISQLKDACSKLKWCVKALSFPTAIPTHKVIYFFSVHKI